VSDGVTIGEPTLPRSSVQVGALPENCTEIATADYADACCQRRLGGCSMIGSKPGIGLRVGDAQLEDIAEGRARISRDSFDALRLSPDELVRIVGQRPLLARAHLAGVEDDGLELVRLDGSQRRVLGVGLGDLVDVQPYEATPATRVRLVAIGSRRSLELSPYDIRAALGNRPIEAGETLAVSPARRDFKAEVSLLGINLVGVVGSSSGAHAALVRVVQTSPPGIVRLTDETVIDVLPPGDVDALPDAENAEE